MNEGPSASEPRTHNELSSNVKDSQIKGKINHFGTGDIHNHYVIYVNKGDKTNFENLEEEELLSTNQPLESHGSNTSSTGDKTNLETLEEKGLLQTNQPSESHGSNTSVTGDKKNFETLEEQELLQTNEISESQRSDTSSKGQLVMLDPIQKHKMEDEDTPDHKSQHQKISHRRLHIIFVIVLVIVSIVVVVPVVVVVVTQSEPADGEKTVTSRDCADVAHEGHNQSGVYDIIINSKIVTVYCDLQTLGGKWLVIQRRQDGSVNFNRTWDDYVAGFGDKTGEFWLGLENIHQVTSSGNYELQIDLEDWYGTTAYAKYKVFAVGNASSDYELRVETYAGTAGDSFTYNNKAPFSTKDHDNDIQGSNCPDQNLYGAWWAESCTFSNLNGKYFEGGRVDQTSVYWYNWKRNWYSLKRADMKIRLL